MYARRRYSPTQGDVRFPTTPKTPYTKTMPIPGEHQPDPFEKIVIENDLEPFMGMRQARLIAAIDHRSEHGPPFSESDLAAITSLAHILRLGESTPTTPTDLL